MFASAPFGKQVQNIFVQLGGITTGCCNLYLPFGAASSYRPALLTSAATAISPVPGAQRQRVVAARRIMFNPFVVPILVSTPSIPFQPAAFIRSLLLKRTYY
jgi:hypothetical protein